MTNLLVASKFPNLKLAYLASLKVAVKLMYFGTREVAHYIYYERGEDKKR